MRIINFAKRNFKEIIRDPLSIIFAILLPLFLLFIFQQFNIPSENYKLENFTPGIIIFGFSFLTLFTAMLVAKDRSTSLLIRLGTSPMKPVEYILGYIISIIPIIIIQNILFFIGNFSIYYCCNTIYSNRNIDRKHIYRKSIIGNIKYCSTISMLYRRNVFSKRNARRCICENM